MANPIGLIRRPGSSSYYIQRRYPLDLVEATGKVHFKRSLKTSDRAEAIRRCNAENVKFDEECERLRATLTGTTARASVWTLTEAKRLVQQYVLDQSAKMQADFASGDPKSPSDWREQSAQESSTLIALYRDADCDEAQQDIHNAARQIFRLPVPSWPWEPDAEATLDSDYDVFGEHGPLSHFLELERRELRDIIRRAILEVERRSLATLRSDFRHANFDHIFTIRSPEAQVTESGLFFSISKLAEAYLADYSKSHSKKKIAL